MSHIISSGMGATVILLLAIEQYHRSSRPILSLFPKPVLLEGGLE